MNGGEIQRSVVSFVANELGLEVSQIAQREAFATNAVYEIDARDQRLVVKVSLGDALRAEGWACMKAASAGCLAPSVLSIGTLASDGACALVMAHIGGEPIVVPHPALRHVGASLRRLHDVRLPGFGWLAQAGWDAGGGPSHRHDSWPGFLGQICSDARSLSDSCTLAVPVATGIESAIDRYRESLAIDVGSLCHGDIKYAHIFVDGDRFAGIIDWGDAVVGDPVWDIARFASRVDAQALSWLLDGYRADEKTMEELAWRLPLYEALWVLVDAIVDHQLQRPVDGLLETAMRALSKVPVGR